MSQHIGTCVRTPGEYRSTEVHGSGVPTGVQGPGVTTGVQWCGVNTGVQRSGTSIQENRGCGVTTGVLNLVSGI